MCLFVKCDSFVYISLTHLCLHSCPSLVSRARPAFCRLQYAFRDSLLVNEATSVHVPLPGGFVYIQTSPVISDYIDYMHTEDSSNFN